MDIIITIQHPAHVHFFKNTIWELEQEDHNLYVFARDKDVAVKLLQQMEIPHTVLAGSVDSKLKLPLVQTKYEFSLFKEARKIRPDVLMTIGGPAITHVAKVLGTKSILFIDTEHSKLQKRISVPLVSQIYSPDCFGYNMGEHHSRYPGYHELAYLHPNRFEPDPNVLKEAGLNIEDRFVILRLVDWNAAHDVGSSGFDHIENAVNALEKKGVEVFITAEGTVPESVKHCQVSIAPHQMHDLMYYADLFIGEGGTMASESAVLGTPAVYVNSLTMGYLEELENKYGLVFNYSGADRQKKGLKKALEILETYNEQLWIDRREKMLEDKIDTTDFIIGQINNIIQ